MTMKRAPKPKSATKPRAISASEFRARCFQLMDEVARTRVPIFITKRGRPVAKLVPADKPKPRSLHGYMRGSAKIIGDIVSPIDVEWNANR